MPVSLLEIREDLQPDEEWTRKECFSDAGADELLRCAARDWRGELRSESEKEGPWRASAEPSGTRARRRRAEMFGPLGLYSSHCFCSVLSREIFLR